MRLWPIFLSLILVYALITPNLTYSSSDPTPLDIEQVSFTNVTYSAGLQDVGGQFLSWGDYNNDGYQDLLVNGRRLFKNEGPPLWDFSDVSSQVGISGGSYGTWADWNNDGYLDFFCAGSDKLYKNNGPPDYDFIDVTSSSGIMKESHSTGSGWGDYDNDGDVDLFKIRGEDGGTGEYFPNSFWRNEGDGTFTNVTVAAGVDETSSPKYGRGVAWADFDDDGDLDIYITNYRQQFNYLYQNNGDGTFTDVAPEKGVADGAPFDPGNLDPYNRGGHGVGSVWGDYDNDGYLDLWVTNLNHKDVRTSDDSLLMHNDGPPDYTFTNMRGSAGIPVKPYIFPNEGDELFVGCAWGDYDMDGDIDLYLPQIYDIDYAYSFLYMNNGDGTFTDVTVEANVRVWDTYAGCWADYDNDGDLDLITSGRDSGGNGDPHFVHLFRNDGVSGSWLYLNLKGNGYSANTAAIGARVTVTTDLGDSQVKEVEGGTGPHGHQNSLILEFGFGIYSGTVDLEIRWPDGNVQFYENVAVNQIINITESTGDLVVSSIAFSDSNPITGENIRIDAIVRNTGSVTIDSADVRFYLDDVEPGSQIDTTMTVYNIPPDNGDTTNVMWDTTGITGPHTIYVEAEMVDPPPSGPNSTRSKNVYIRLENELPYANLTANQTEIQKFDSVTFDASNSTDDTEIVEYNFDFGDGEESGWITDETIAHAYQSGGDYNASLMVRDEDGALSENTEEVAIKVKVRPVAALTANRTQIYKGESILFDGSGSSDDGGTVEEYNFDFGDGENTGWTSEESVAHNYETTGFFTASLKVRDNDGDESENTQEIEIEVRAEPIASLSADKTLIYKGESITFDASSSYDEGGTVEKYYFDFGDGDSSGWISASSISHTYLWADKFFATLQVRDNDGDVSTNTEDVQITVREEQNQIPTAEIVYISPNPATSGNDVTFSGSGEDLDGTISAYSWRSDLDGVLGSDSTFTTSALSVGTHTIYFKVQDNKDEWSDEVSDALTVKADNEKPTIEIKTPEDNMKVKGTIIITGSSDDSDGVIEFAEIRIGEGSWEEAQGLYDWSYEIDTALYSDGEYTISARAFDGEDYSEEVQITLTFDQKGEDEEKELDILMILMLVVAAIVVVMVLAAAIGMSMKKKKADEDYPGPPQFIKVDESPKEPPGARMNM